MSGKFLAIVASLAIHAVILGLFFLPTGRGADCRASQSDARNDDPTPSSLREAAGDEAIQEKPSSRAPTANELSVATPTEAVPVTPDTPAAIPEFYVVKAGDTLTKIAKAYGTTPEKIALANGKPLNKMNLIWVGQKIKLR